jgi:hypothetical protein
MFLNRIFRTTPEQDFERGPMLAAYLRFELLMWGAIALLSLLSLGGGLLLPTPTAPGAPDPAASLAVTLAFSLGALLVFIAVWRFRRWGVIALILWTAALIVALLTALLTPPQDWLVALALVGFIVARVLVLGLLIRPRWHTFRGGLW